MKNIQFDPKKPETFIVSPKEKGVIVKGTFSKTEFSVKNADILDFVFKAVLVVHNPHDTNGMVFENFEEFFKFTEVLQLG